MKRTAEPPLTPAASIDENISSLTLPSEGHTQSAQTHGGPDLEPSSDVAQEPPKKKRRAALTRVGDIGS
jgi:chromatin assembly factor 1 subunit B